MSPNRERNGLSSSSSTRDGPLPLGLGLTFELMTWLPQPNGIRLLFHRDQTASCHRGRQQCKTSLYQEEV